jgi:predicted enzyme related to lactoylglutathione lyase
MATRKPARRRGKKAAPRKKPAKKAAPRKKPAKKTAARARKPARRAARPAKKPAVRAAKPAAKPAAPAVFPNAVGLLSLHMDYNTQAMDAVRRFYTDLLGFARSEFDPQMNYLYVQASPTASLGFMPPTEGTPESWRPPGEATIYLFVKDVDRACGDLKAKGVLIDQDPTDQPWGHRVALLKDPEGRRICLAQVIKKA